VAVAVPLVGTVAALPIGASTRLLTAAALAADRLTLRAAAAVVVAAAGAAASALPAVAPAWQSFTRDLPPPPPLPPRGRGGAAAAAHCGGSEEGGTPADPAAAAPEADAPASLAALCGALGSLDAELLASIDAAGSPRARGRRVADAASVAVAALTACCVRAVVAAVDAAPVGQRCASDAALWLGQSWRRARRRLVHRRPAGEFAPATAAAAAARYASGS